MTLLAFLNSLAYLSLGDTIPLAKSWAEELVSEYYALRGYLVLTDVPIGTGRRGGRRDVDVVAIDVRDKSIYLVDVKVIWIGKTENIASDIVKRLENTIEVLENIYGEGYKYRKVAVIIGEPGRPKLNRIRELLREKDIDVIGLHELIVEVVDYIDKWRKEMMKRQVTRTEHATLPENLYLLKLLEYMKDSDMIKTVTY